jgi:hypothetical protein
MGKLALILVLGAFITTALLSNSATTSTLRAEERVWTQHYQLVARDAATTGMSATVRKLAGRLNQNWSDYLYEFNSPTVTYNGSKYSVTSVLNQCNILSPSRLTNVTAAYTGGQIIQVTATGRMQSAAGPVEHELVACYLQADWNSPTPPAFQYSFISNQHFNFNGGPDIKSLDGEGNVHSNGQMDLGPQVEIIGHATYSTPGGDNKSTKVMSYEEGPSVPMTAFDPEDFRTDNAIPASGSGSVITDDYRFDDGDLTLGGNSTTMISGTSEPFVWFIDGNLTIDADVQIPASTVIVATGTVEFKGKANVTTTGTTPPKNATDDQLKAWVESQLIDGHPPGAWYANGNVSINGSPNVVGNFYTNGSFTLDGGGNGGNLIGSVAAMDGITANGGGNGNNFWFVEISDQNVIPGVLLPGKQLVRVAVAEWINPLLVASAN